ncbi:DUF1187 family protein [Gilliamella sp. BG7]|uniref:DUF1187 family protein n=1 Tax=unclassified Gilliamella TaxID=2685620 RepID=UPI00398740D0
MAYKITATIIKKWQLPISWMHFTDEKLTIEQCIKKLSNGKELVQLDNFECVRV